jgi:hypothetical protein
MRRKWAESSNVVLPTPPTYCSKESLIKAASFPNNIKSRKQQQESQRKWFGAMTFDLKRIFRTTNSQKLVRVYLLKHGRATSLSDSGGRASKVSFHFIFWPNVTRQSGIQRIVIAPTPMPVNMTISTLDTKKTMSPYFSVTVSARAGSKPTNLILRVNEALSPTRWQYQYQV